VGGYPPRKDSWKRTRLVPVLEAVAVIFLRFEMVSSRALEAYSIGLPLTFEL